MSAAQGKDKKGVVVLFIFCAPPAFLLEPWAKLGGYPLYIVFPLCLHSGDEDPLSQIPLEIC